MDPTLTPAATVPAPPGSAAPSRAFDFSLDIAASPDDVWRALTEAGELVRWFPLDARVTPGQGGTMLWSWGEQWDWQSTIEVWQPGRRLRLVQADARPYDAEGRPLPDGQAEPARIAMEFTLEAHRGKTRLRLVHSGFGRGAAWDDELDGITEGWQVELRSLRHYLERHRGRNRMAGRAWLTTSLDRATAWDRLIGPGGFELQPAEPRPGERYQVTAPDGSAYHGTVELILPRQTMAGTVDQLSDGWFRLLTWSIPGGGTGVWAWLSTHAGDDGRVAAFQARSQEALSRLFPEG